MFMVSYDAARTTYMWIDNHSKGDDDFIVPDRTNPAGAGCTAAMNDHHDQAPSVRFGASPIVKLRMEDDEQQEELELARSTECRQERTAGDDFQVPQATRP